MGSNLAKKKVVKRLSRVVVCVFSRVHFMATLSAQIKLHTTPVTSITSLLTLLNIKINKLNSKQL